MEQCAYQSQNVSATKSTILSTTNVSVLPTWSSSPPRTFAVTQLAQSAKDGMAKDAFLWLAHLVHGSTEQTVFAPTQETDAYHGNCGTAIAALISKTNVLLELNGTRKNAKPNLAAIVLKDFTCKAPNVLLFLRDVYQVPAGSEVDVFLTLVLAPMAQSDQTATVNPTHNAQMVKTGMLIHSNASAPREQDGVEKNAWSVQEVKSGTCGMAVLALMATSWPVPSARNQTATTVN